MKVRFVKMHGAGNDFVMIDDRDGKLLASSGRLAAIANRPDGIGCEGVILLRRSTAADFAMFFFNPDGSEADMCGNGARCVAAFAKAVGAVRGDAMRFETRAGSVAARVLDSGAVEIALPPPKDLRGDFVNTGVPHKIVPVGDLAAVDVAEEGRRVRFSAEFGPGGANVDFVRFHPPDALDIRTYERGVEAETFACGTGAVAAAVVGVASHGLRFPVSVRTARGDILAVDGRREGATFVSITLTGPVRTVFSGEIEVEG
ncbi:MAG: diaminopimelate epimerase [Kiritimatiellae bacterium]|nr:diaminopimelate epimerase [Kiritimatiellia bacterium]